MATTIINSRFSKATLVSMAALFITIASAQAFAQDKTAQGKISRPDARVGVSPSRKVTLTLADAIMMGLENNRDIEVERLNIRLNELDVQAARGAYDPVLESSFFYDRRTTPVASLLAGGEDGRLRTSELTGATSLVKRLPWQGASVQMTFDHSRSTSTNPFYSLDPQFITGLSFDFVQPLFRNREIDAPRREIKIAKKKLDLSDSLFRQKAIEIIAQVQSAYWNLVFALRDEAIKRESVELARAQLESNKLAAEKGSIAPLDVVSARVEVERRTEEAEAALETVQRAENALKALLLKPDNSDLWGSSVVPSDEPRLDAADLPRFEDAMRLALQNRPEMEQYRIRGEINKIDVKYFRDQAKPQIDFIAGYQTAGLSGTKRSTSDPISASSEQIVARVNELSKIAGLSALAPVVAGDAPEKFIGGYGQSLTNLFRNEYRSFRFGVTISLPVGNRTAKAQLGRAIVEGKQVDVERQRAVQTIEVEVRNGLQAVETARRRFDAARNSRLDAEMQNTGERRRFEAGLSTNFLVLDRQNALSSARGRELKALTDYNKAVTELQRALSTTLSTNNISIAALKNTDSSAGGNR
ncbi:MAG TPA: TolC family protein [Blastocatellia bacterium]|nr:TolC family protein [Blastocatellia bacterium]